MLSPERYPFSKVRGEFLERLKENRSGGVQTIGMPLVAMLAHAQGRVEVCAN
jgi:hypothetical protein